MTPPSRKAAAKPSPAERKPKGNAGAFKPGDERINRTKPGPGRPKDRFKRLCQKLTMRSTRKYCRKILRNPDHQHYMAALRWASEHGFGKPDAKLEVAGKLTIEQLVAASNQPEKKK